MEKRITIEQAVLLNTEAATKHAKLYPADYRDVYELCKRMQVYVTMDCDELAIHGTGHSYLDLGDYSGKWTTKSENWHQILAKYPGTKEELVYLAIVEHVSEKLYAGALDGWFLDNMQLFAFVVPVHVFPERKTHAG